MKFLHIADVHIGCWRNRAMKQLSVKAFEKVCAVAVEEHVDFVVIAGDLFHTALPGIDLVKSVFKQLRMLKDESIPVYYIAGSHDYSPTGKTMLDVIEEAKLGSNVAKGKVKKNGAVSLTFTEDEETGVLLTGIIGKAGMLDQKDYQGLETEPLEDKDGQKIFLFHTAIDELKPDRLSQMDSSGISFLPKDFEYYAGGHVHIVRDMNMKGYQNVVYPGPLFPTTFRELEVLKHGTYALYEDGTVHHKHLRIKETASHTIDIGEGSPDEANKYIKQALEGIDVEDKIVLLRVKGYLKGGSLGDVGFRDIHEDLMSRGAFHVMRNTSSVSTESFDADIVEEREQSKIEEELIHEYSGQIENRFSSEKQVTKNLFRDWDDEKREGETNTEFEERVISIGESLMASAERREDKSSSSKRKPDLTSFMQKD